MYSCACEEIGSVRFDDRLRTLEMIREQCPVIKQLLIPAKNWEAFKTFEAGKRDEALHASKLVVALLNGDLGRITLPIHKFLFNQDGPKAELMNQYREDLQERWMFAHDEISRHQKGRIFDGRVVELQIAEWLEKRGWVITGLEALGCTTDIECVRPISHESSVEVKFIGQRDEEFQQVVNALAGRPAGGLGSGNVGCNYLLLRLYEAASQLRTVDRRRIAVVVIDQSAYTFLSIPLENNWINWAAPTFLEAGLDWTDFLTEQRNRYPTIESDLGQTIGSLHEFWIIIRVNGHQYYLQSHHLI